MQGCGVLAPMLAPCIAPSAHAVRMTLRCELSPVRNLLLCGIPDVVALSSGCDARMLRCASNASARVVMCGSFCVVVHVRRR